MTIFKSHIYDMKPYQPPLEGRSVKDHLLLDFNERTVSIHDSVIRAICDFAQSGEVQKYPSYGDIEELLANYVGLSQEQIMITNGSDQGIDLVMRATLGPGDEAIIPSPTFAMYRQSAEVEQAKIISPCYRKDIGYPIEEVLDAITDQTRLVVAPLPNNPCGSSIELTDIEAIARRAPQAIILVDECYFEYSGLTAIPLIDQFNNIVITRTFSKTWGLPSLRFGFVVTNKDNIEQLLKIRGPYDINQFAVVAARAALADKSFVEEYVEEVMQTSKVKVEQWLSLHGIDYWKSYGNYIWMFPKDPEMLAQELQIAGILVRPKTNSDGHLGLRVTIGTKEQTDQLIDILSTLI